MVEAKYNMILIRSQIYEPGTNDVAKLILTLSPTILVGVATKAKILSNYLRRAGQDANSRLLSRTWHTPSIERWFKPRIFQSSFQIT